MMLVDVLGLEARVAVEEAVAKLSARGEDRLNRVELVMKEPRPQLLSWSV